MEVAILIATVVVWAVVHSWLASPPVKDIAARVLGPQNARLYRLGYNAFAALSFVPILLMMRLLPDHVIYAVPSPWKFLLLAGQALAGLCLLAALLQTDLLHFLGVRQIVGPNAGAQLNTRGFYDLVRHPLYLFGLLFLWLTPLLTLNLLTVFVLLSIYLFVGATFEERRLLEEFGTQYRDYRLRTPMIIPSFWKRRRGEVRGGTDASR